MSIAWLVGVLMSSCTEVIEFETQNEGGQLVVDGRLVVGQTSHRLKLTRTTSTNQQPVPEGLAEVTLYDGRGNAATYTPLGDGRYQLSDSQFKVEASVSYWIQIVTPDGAIYESEPQVAPGLGARQDSLSADFETREVSNTIGNVIINPYINVYTNATLLPENGVNYFYRWDIEEVYLLTPTDFPDPFGVIPPPCFVYEYPNKQDFQLLDGREIAADKIERLLVGTQVLDLTFDEKHYFNVYMVSLPERAFTYWSQVQQTISSVGTIFDTPPAPISSNIYNINNPDEEVLGFFEVVAIDTVRRVFFPSDIPRSSLKPCVYYPYVRDYPDRCLDCLSVPNSTYERPDYF